MPIDCFSYNTASATPTTAPRAGAPSKVPAGAPQLQQQPEAAGTAQQQRQRQQEQEQASSAKRQYVQRAAVRASRGASVMGGSGDGYVYDPVRVSTQPPRPRHDGVAASVMGGGRWDMRRAVKDAPWDAASGKAAASVQAVHRFGESAAWRWASHL